MVLPLCHQHDCVYRANKRGEEGTSQPVMSSAERELVWDSLSWWGFPHRAAQTVLKKRRWNTNRKINRTLKDSVQQTGLCTGWRFNELKMFKTYSLVNQLDLCSSSSIVTTAHCGLWLVEQCSSIFLLSATNSLHLLTPSTWRSLSTSSFHLFLAT